MASGGLSRHPTHRGRDDGLWRRCRPPAPPVALCVAVGGGVAGFGRGGGFARRGPAGGLMAGGAGARRPTRIAGSWPSKSPLRAL